VALAAFEVSSESDVKVALGATIHGDGVVEDNGVVVLAAVETDVL
jgi:hypothetical protein